MRRFIVLVFFVVMALPTFALAATEYAGSPAGSAIAWENGGSVGSEFISKVTATVIELGVYDYGDTLVTPHLVSLWDSSGNLLTSVTVDNSDPKSADGYRWATATAPIMAGHEYVILAKYYGAGWNAGDMIGVNPTISPDFTFVQDRDSQANVNYGGGTPMTDPNPGSPEYTTGTDNNYFGVGFFGPNLQAVVPEPATLVVWSLLGAASWLGMKVWRGGQRLSRPAWSPENRQAILEVISRGQAQ